MAVKKTIIFNIICLTLVCAAMSASELPTPTITIDASSPQRVLSPEMYGIFFEEINHAGDGGLYAEMVQKAGTGKVITSIRRSDGKLEMRHRTNNRLLPPDAGDLGRLLYGSTASFPAGHSWQRATWKVRCSWMKPSR